jgi:hypothetical protein
VFRPVALYRPAWPQTTFLGGERPPGLVIHLGADLFYLVAKFPLMGDDVDELRCTYTDHRTMVDR